MPTPSPTAAYLDAFRRGVERPEQTRARNLDRVRRRLAAGEVVDDAEDADAVPQPSAWSRRAAAIVAFAKPISLSVGLATAGLGVVKLSAATWMSEVQRPAPAVSPKPDPPTPRVEAVTPTPSKPAADSGGAAPAADASQEPLAAAPVPVRAATRPVPDRLQRELALIRRAQSNLDGTRYEAALSDLAKHAAEFPDGALQEERRAWRAIALCKLGHVDAAAATKSFFARHRTSPLAPKVQAACGK